MKHLLIAITLCMAITRCIAANAATPPNIVFVLADDLGYGDLGCYNPDSKIPTPNLDRLASEGMRFTDMHSGSAVCTPTRYGVITGRYSWRSTMQRGVLQGLSQPLIPENLPTLPAFLKANGYETAGIGKWHLGLGWTYPDGKTDYAATLTGGPTALGFDSYFGIPASLDMPPYVYIENDHVAEAATNVIEDRLKPLYWRGGPIAPHFTHEGVLPSFKDRAAKVIEKYAADKSGKPLFLYLALSAPHTPILPTGAKGRTTIGDYGDFVCDVDDTVGTVLEILEKAGMRENTMVIFTDDNGFAPYAGLAELRAKGHEPCPGLRGSKADIFEGGHRVPFIVRWPGMVAPGTTCTTTAWLGDFFATTAEVLGQKLAENTAVDSESLLPAFLGRDLQRDPVVHHSADGYFAIREGQWKLIFASHSGGWSNPKPAEAKNLDLPPLQLYDLATDLKETTNVVDAHPDIVARLTARMESYIANGRSTPGTPQKNDAEVVLMKKP